MAEHETQIANYFRVLATGGYSGHESLELNFLHEAACKALTEQFSFHPAVSRLDGLILDDSDTSNHHVLLRCHPLRGQILYLAHDGESRVVFPSLASLLSAAERARRDEVTLSETHPELSPLAGNQIELSNTIRELVADEEIDVVLMLIPSMDLNDLVLLSQLATHDDFYVVECVAEEIARRPSWHLREVAQLCAAHRHVQKRLERGRRRSKPLPSEF